jgi:pyrroline-5-carboxylate reductase
VPWYAAVCIIRRPWATFSAKDDNFDPARSRHRGRREPSKAISAFTMTTHITFIGGGNMASAIIGGLLKQGMTPRQIDVVEPFADARARLLSQFGVTALHGPGPALAKAELVVWAVKPQTFKEAALQTSQHTQHALHLSVAAGIRSDSIASWLGTQRIVRAMPNTPALVGKGMTAMFGRPAVTVEDRRQVERVIATTGQFLWVEPESQLDAVTALSGSGPAYVFYFLEAMTRAGPDMGLTRDQAHQLAVGTFVGASELARASDEPPEVLRQRVTSKGGTTYAAIMSMEQDNVKNLFMRALQAARRRAHELGDEFGA